MCSCVRVPYVCGGRGTWGIKAVSSQERFSLSSLLQPRAACEEYAILCAFLIGGRLGLSHAFCFFLGGGAPSCAGSLPFFSLAGFFSGGFGAATGSSSSLPAPGDGGGSSTRPRRPLDHRGAHRLDEVLRHGRLIAQVLKFKNDALRFEFIA